jgi:hypothetical protein
MFYNRNSANLHILKAVICAGLYPNIIVVDKAKAMPKLTNRAGEVFLHPACLDAGQESALDSNILVYHEIVKTAKVCILFVCGAVCGGKGSRGQGTGLRAGRDDHLAIRPPPLRWSSTRTA